MSIIISCTHTHPKIPNYEHLCTCNLYFFLFLMHSLCPLYMTLVVFKAHQIIQLDLCPHFDWTKFTPNWTIYFYLWVPALILSGRGRGRNHTACSIIKSMNQFNRDRIPLNFFVCGYSYRYAPYTIEKNINGSNHQQVFLDDRLRLIDSTSKFFRRVAISVTWIRLLSALESPQVFAGSARQNFVRAGLMWSVLSVSWFFFY